MRIRIALPGTLLLGFSCYATGQEITATILGTVTDSSGAVVSGARSGTSAYHGSAFEFFRNDVLAANNFFNNLRELARPPLRYNNFGFTIGGPVLIPRVYSKKTFFFFSQEWRRVINYSTFTSAQVPTKTELQGTFATPVCTEPVIDPATQPCVGPTTTQVHHEPSPADLR